MADYSCHDGGSPVVRGFLSNLDLKVAHLRCDFFEFVRDPNKTKKKCWHAVIFDSVGGVLPRWQDSKNILI